MFCSYCFRALKLIFGNKKNFPPKPGIQSQMETIAACHVTCAHIVPFSSNSQMSCIVFFFLFSNENLFSSSENIPLLSQQPLHFDPLIQ